MKHESGSRKGRGRGNGGGGRRNGGGNRSKSGESGGSGVKVRGNTAQVLEKYLSLARDAASTSDRVAAENYFQHAEHYYRVLHSADERQEASKRAKPGNGKAQSQTKAETEAEPAPEASPATSEA